MYIQSYANKTSVVEEAKKRVSFIFDNFDDISVSVSGGKDSTVMAHLMLSEANRRGRKVQMFFLDEEVMYQSSIDQVEYLMFEMFPENVTPMWFQIEFNLTNAISLEQSQLKCWESGKHKLWMRKRRKGTIQFAPWDRESETIGNKTKGFGFYDAIANYEAMHTNTAFCVGLRALESMNRWRTMVKNPVTISDNEVFWATKKGENFSMYPIFDWTFSDIWKYIGENKLRYSKIYDYQFKKGYALNEMRVSSLIHEKSYKSICDLPEFEPKTYNKLVKRVKGTSFGQETGKDSKMFKARKLPKNFESWISYRDFLMQTYPDKDILKNICKEI